MSNNMPPGWYYADGDPPGTQRYWNGSSWQGEAQPVAQSTGFAVTKTGGYPESSQSGLALALSIVGFVLCCLITCPIGWWLGDAELKAIEAGRRDPSNQGVAKAARIIGIIGTVLMVIGLVSYGGLVVLAGVGR